MSDLIAPELRLAKVHAYPVDVDVSNPIALGNEFLRTEAQAEAYAYETFRLARLLLERADLTDAEKADVWTVSKWASDDARLSGLRCQVLRKVVAQFETTAS